MYPAASLSYIKSHCLLRAATIAVVFYLLASTAVAEHLPVKTYTVADGLLRDSVYKIKQDSQGFLWFCTPEGVSRFDGYEFTNFTVDDGLPDRHANDFIQTAGGDVYIATDGGLARLNPTGRPASPENPLFSIFRIDSSASAKFQTMLALDDQRILCGTDDGVFVFDGKNFSATTFKSLPENPEILDIKRASGGRIWVSTSSNGLFYSDDGTNFVSGPILPEVTLPALFIDLNGRVWAGMRPGKEGGLCRLSSDGNSLDKCFFPHDGLPSGWITSILESRDGKMWIGTTESLCEFQEGAKNVCRVYSQKNDICDADVFSVFEDKDNNLWIGSRCGLKKMSRRGFSYFDQDDGLGEGVINSIFEDDGGFYTSIITPSGRQIGRLDGDSFTSFVPRLSDRVLYFGWGWKQTVLHDSQGAWWVPTGSGLFRSPPHTRFEQLSTDVLQRVVFPVGDKETFRIFEDSNSNVWVATTGRSVELWRWNRRENEWTDLTQQAGVGATRQVTAFTDDGKGNLWIATGSDANNTAVICFTNDDVLIFTAADNELIRGWLRDIYIDRSGRIWIASTATGLLRIDLPISRPLKIERYSSSNGLSSSGVYCVTEDASGNIYAGTGRGLDRLDPSSGVVENFTTFDGLPDSTVEVAYRDKKDQLWFGTSKGLAHFIPDTNRTRQSPALMITGLRVNGAPQNVSILGESNISNMDFDSSRRSVSVDFVGLGATLGEKLRYEYKLNNAEWTPTNERTLNFADLQSGNYSLSIRAITRDSIVTAIPATLSFRIATPIWQRWWFILGLSALAGLLVYLIYRNRINKLLELERTRTRIATDLHDDIGSNLSKIALLSELVKMKLTNGNNENNRMLATIAEVSRETVDSMRDIVWSINPGRDTILETTRRMREHAEDALVPLGATVHFNTDGRHQDQAISMDVRRELFLIFKEAVNNAAKYSDCKNVWIDFNSNGRSISMTVKDDGKGFDTTLPPQSNGLSNMLQRAERVGGRFDIESGLGIGTTVSVTIDSSESARLYT